MTAEPERTKRTPQEVALARLRRKLEREAAAAASATPAPAPALDAAPVAAEAARVSATREFAWVEKKIAAPAEPLPADNKRREKSGKSRRSPTPASARTRGTAAERVSPTRPATAQTNWQRRLDAYERLIRLEKPIGWMLLLWPTLTALWIASWGRPTVADIVIFVVGTVLMRSAGCALNDWADRDFDGKVKRTADRPLATGEITPREALALAGMLAACAFALVCFTNKTTILLSIPALLIAIAYPFVKRVFAVPQAFLGIAFSFGIPMAFAAETGSAPWIAWIMLGINLFWVVAYDTEYAMVDRDDDVNTGIHTSAITFGRYDILAIAVCYAIYLGGMTWVGFERRLGPYYFAGLAVAGALAVYHVVLIRTRDRERCFQAFRHNAWFGLVVFAGTVLALVIKYRAWPTLH